MALIRFFKTPPHQRYVYKPRFWDPLKDDVKERVDKPSDSEEVKARIAGHFARRGRHGANTSGYRAREVSRSNFRLLIVLVVIILLTYMVFLTLPRFLVLFQ
jgi:hypothetical protein